MPETLELLQRVLDGQLEPLEPQQLTKLLVKLCDGGAVDECKWSEVTDCVVSLLTVQRYTALRSVTHTHLIECCFVFCAACVNDSSALQSPAICAILHTLLRSTVLELVGESSARRTCECLRSWLLRP
uniref:Uncharacterized protein n=1 Tax=Lygus hesperus TaxID=30085 RepID=A0A146M802_LYGHE